MQKSLRVMSDPVYLYQIADRANHMSELGAWGGTGIFHGAAIRWAQNATARKDLR